MLTDIQATTNSVSFSDRTVVTMPTINPASLSSSSLTQESIEELDANFEYASKKGKEKGWGTKEVSASEPPEDILETSINIFDEPNNKPVVIAHNAYAIRGFIGVSQELSISFMRCDGIELDLSYSGNTLIVSHREQSYFGIINPAASASNLDPIIKQLPTALENNKTTPYNKFIIWHCPKRVDSR